MRGDFGVSGRRVVPTRLNVGMGELELAALAETQGGLVTRPQTRAQLTREQVKHRLATGRLVAVRWGVYRCAGTPVTPMPDLRAALPRCRSGRGDLPPFGRGLVGLPVGRERGDRGDRAVAAVATASRRTNAPERPTSGRALHRPQRRPRDHRGARTVADLACVFRAPFVGRLADACPRRGLFGLAELHGVYDVLAGRGRHGMAVLAEALARRPLGYEPGGSAAELDVVSILAEHGVPLPVQQFQVVIDVKVIVLDFAHPELRIALEYDGYAFHRLPSDLDRLAARHTALTLAEGPSCTSRRRRATAASWPRSPPPGSELSVQLVAQTPTCAEKSGRG